MEKQKEMVEFIKWIATNVKGFEKSTPEEIVTAINSMAQSEEGKKSLQELYTQFQSSKKKLQFGGIIPRMQGGGDTLRYMTLRPIVTTHNGYPEQIGEDRTVARRYSTYSSGTAPARREFYTEDGYARRINGNDTIWLKRRPIAYTPAGNPENKEDANYVHIWEEVMPTSWLRTMFNGEPDSVEGPEVVESQQNGGRILGVTHSGWRNNRRVLVPGQTHEYYDSYAVEGPSDDRIEEIVQTEYPNRHILRIKDRPDSKPVFMGDKFGPFGLLDQDSLRNAWDSLINLKTTYPNIENKKIDNVEYKKDGGSLGNTMNHGEIYSDDRSSFKRWWDTFSTNYRNSSFANSAVGKTLSFLTPLGALDSAANGDMLWAAASILPLGMADDAVRALRSSGISKLNPLKFPQIKGYKNFNVSNGRIVGSAKGPLTEEMVQRIYNENAAIRDLVDQGFNVTTTGLIMTPSRKTFTNVDDYLRGARDEISKARRAKTSRSDRNAWQESQRMLRENLGDMEYEAMMQSRHTSGNKAKSASGYIHPSKYLR